MVLNYIWILFFVLSFIILLIKLIFLGDTTAIATTVNAITDSSKTAFEISLGLTGVMCFWLGIMKVGEKVTFLFPSHLAYGYLGDNKRIDRNVPLLYTVTLNKIEKSTN